MEQLKTDTLCKSENPTITSDFPIPNVFNALSGHEQIKPEMPDNVVNSAQHCLTERSCFKTDLTCNYFDDQQIKTEKPDICINDFYHGLNEPSFSVKAEPTDSAVAENGQMDTIKPVIDGNSVNCWQTDQSYVLKNDEWDARMEHFKPDVSHLDLMVKSAQKETIVETEEPEEPELKKIEEGSINPAVETSSDARESRQPCDLAAVSSVSSTQKRTLPEKPFKCESCSESFERPTLLNVHKFTHSLPYLCNVCSARFSEYFVLKGHMVTHAKEKPPICDICSKRYGNHCGPGRKRKRDANGFECAICLKKCPADLSLTRHTKTQSSSEIYSHVPAHKQNDTDAKRLRCSLCPEQFSTPYDLNEHLKTHAAKKRFLCDICGDGFSQPADLIDHRQTHSAEKAYWCGVCRKMFRRPMNLIIHQRTRVVDKRLRCNQCS